MSTGRGHRINVLLLLAMMAVTKAPHGTWHAREEMKCMLICDVAMVGGGREGERATGGLGVAAAAVATHSRSPQVMPAGGEAGGGDANARVASIDLPWITTSAGLSGCACSRAAARAPPHLTSPRPHHTPV